MAFQLSPGVNVSELDLTNTIPAVSTSIGAFCGMFKWGPGNKRIPVDSENTLVAKFGKPDDTNFTTFLSAANFLAYTNNLIIVRALSANTLNATANTTGVGLNIDNEDDYEINFPLGTYTTYGAFYGRYSGTLGNSLTIATCSSNTAFKDTFTATTNTGSSTVICSKDVSQQLTSGDFITVSGTAYTVSSVVAANVFITSAATANVVAGNTTSTWQYYSQFDTAPTTSIYGTSQGATNDELHIITVDTDGKFSGERGTVLEKFSHVSKAVDAKTDNGSPNYYPTVLFNTSKYIYSAAHLTGAVNWGNALSNTAFTTLNNTSVKLAGGSDTVPSTADIVSGYSLFGNPDEVDISLVISGDANSTIANKCLDLAYQRKDCVAFISPLRQDAVTAVSSDNIISYRNSMTPSTSYGFFDSGWKYQFDKYNNKYRYVPLSADIAGLCARTDNIRDPWWSPAGFNRGQIFLERY